jgi:hypothetical protein
MKKRNRRKHPGSSDSRNQAAQSTGRPLKICVVFDEDDSARAAEVLIRHVASDYQCDKQSFRFDELDARAPGVAAARSAADTDILVLAIRDDSALPSHVRLWLGLCLGLRHDGEEGAFVALITKTADTAKLDKSLAEYLQAVALIGGMAFFLREQDFQHERVTIMASAGVD